MANENEIKRIKIDELVEFVQASLSSPVFDGNIVCRINESSWGCLRGHLKLEEIHVGRKTYRELIFNRSQSLSMVSKLDQRSCYQLTDKDFVVFYIDCLASPFYYDKEMEIIHKRLLPRNVTVFQLI